MSDVRDYALHYATTRGIPMFGYQEREHFGDAFFDWLMNHRLVHAREIQLSFSLGVIEQGIVVISPKGGFTNVRKNHADPRLIETRRD